MKKIFVILFILFLTGCHTKINNIQSTWYGINNKMMFIFKENGDCKSGIYDQQTNKRYLSSCTYKIKNNKLSIYSGDEIEKYEISFENKILILKTENNNKLKFKK